jgi:Zn-dependent protease
LSSLIPQPLVTCQRCGHPLAEAALACESCHALVHAEELDRLKSYATQLETQGNLAGARDEWLKMLPLLPAQATQAEWIAQHARKLDAAAKAAETEQSQKKWASRLGPLGPIAILLIKGKALLFSIFKLKFLLSLAAFLAFYWTLFGAKFGVGFVVLILLHELGHYIDVKRRGLPAEMPVFLPGLGAYVQWQALGVSPATRAEVSLAGPFAGLISSAICAAIWWKTGSALWAALAHTGAWLNLLNLIPIWLLDGGQAATVLSKNARALLLLACLAFWYLFGESVYFLVAAGTTYRLFTNDIPTENNSRIAGYFLFLLAALGLLLWLMPLPARS